MSVNADCVWSQVIDFVLSLCLLLDKVKRNLKCLQTIKKKMIKIVNKLGCLTSSAIAQIHLPRILRKL